MNREKHYNPSKKKTFGKYESSTPKESLSIDIKGPLSLNQFK